MDIRKLVATCALAALVGTAGAAHAAILSIQLGPSSQNYVLYGQGPISATQGSFTNQQGFESYDVVGNTTSDLLSGAITTSSNPGLASGSYSFVTTYNGFPIGAGGQQVQSFSDPSNLSFFFYGALDPSVDMTVHLTGTPLGNRTFHLVTNGAFDGPAFTFNFTGGTCTGVAICDQNTVGLTPGATLSSPTVILLTLAVPEPAAWTGLLIGFGAVGAVMRTRRRQVATAA